MSLSSSHLKIISFLSPHSNPSLPIKIKSQNPSRIHFHPSSISPPFLSSSSITKHHLLNPSPNTPGITNPNSSSSDHHLLSLVNVVCPSLAYANAYFFKSAYNIQVITADNEPEDKLVNRFRKEVLKAGVLQECKRRRFFETTQEKKKRKKRDAARRFRKRRPPAKGSQEFKEEVVKKGSYNSDDDNWDFQDVELPYCSL